MKLRLAVHVGTIAIFCALSAFWGVSAGLAGPLLYAGPDSPSLATPVAVFGRDDRVPLPERLAGMESKIGLLYESRSRSVCTAFCVGDRVIATAGHCIFRTSEEKAPALNGFVFRIKNGKSLATSTIANAAAGGGAQNVTSGAMRINTRPPIDASRDWALIKLSKPVCQGNALRLTLHSPEQLTELADAKRVYQVAYHRDFANWKLAYGPGCEVRRDFKNASWNVIARDFTEANHLVLHTCDTGGASSGSPLLIDGPQGPEVVGISVGTYWQSRVQLQNGEVTKRFKDDAVANTGVSTSAFAGKLETFQRADLLTKMEDVKQLQLLLEARGLHAGTPDGAYGPQLRAAIELFEREENRPVTGLATVALLQRLSVVAGADALKAATTVKADGPGLTSRAQRTRREH